MLVERLRTGTFQEIFSKIRLTGLGCLLDKEGEGKVNIRMIRVFLAHTTGLRES